MRPGPVQAGELFDPLAFEMAGNAGGSLPFAFLKAKEGADVGQQRLAALVPIRGIAKVQNRFAEVDETDFLSADVPEGVEFLAEPREEGEFEALAGFAGKRLQAQGHRRSERLELFGDQLTADGFQHAAQTVEQVLDGQELQGAAGFEVVLDALLDLVEAGEILAVGGAGGAAEGVTEPAGIVVVDLMAADLDDGAVA